jgi:hypothetical protein
LPSWYTSKPRDDNLYIYEVGEGKTRDDAINNALNNLSKNINLRITNGQGNQKHNINFPQYFVKQTLKRDGVSYVLINFNKSEFLQLQTDNLADEEKILNSKLEKIKGRNDLLKLRDYEDIYRAIDNIRSKILVIKTLDNFNDEKYKKMFNAIDDGYSKFLKNLSVSVKFGDSRLLPVHDDIVNYFAKENIAVKNKSNNVFLVEIDMDSSYLYNVYLIDCNVKFLLKSFDEIIYYNSVNARCSSAMSYDDCFNKIILQIKKIFTNDGGPFKYE